MRIRSTARPYPDTTLTQKQLGAYMQDQIKLDRFTLVLSGRNDWVATSQATIHIGAALHSREDSKFSGRAGLIYNFDFGLAPYVSYATSYNPVIGLNARPVAAAGNRPANRSRASNSSQTASMATSACAGST